MVEYAYTLTAEQLQQWLATYPDEYNEWLEAGLLVIEDNAGYLYEAPEWMTDADPTTGPFDLVIRNSQGTIGG